MNIWCHTGQGSVSRTKQKPPGQHEGQQVRCAFKMRPQSKDSWSQHSQEGEQENADYRRESPNTYIKRYINTYSKNWHNSDGFQNSLLKIRKCNSTYSGFPAYQWGIPPWWPPQHSWENKTRLILKLRSRVKLERGTDGDLVSRPGVDGIKQVVLLWRHPQAFHTRSCAISSAVTHRPVQTCQIL